MSASRRILGRKGEREGPKLGDRFRRPEGLFKAIIERINLAGWVVRHRVIFYY